MVVWGLFCFAKFVIKKPKWNQIHFYLLVVWQLIKFGQLVATALSIIFGTSWFRCYGCHYSSTRRFTRKRVELWNPCCRWRKTTTHLFYIILFILVSYRQMPMSDEDYHSKSRCMMSMLPSVKVQRCLPKQKVRTSFNMEVQ